jgi:hypothetical protein
VSGCPEGATKPRIRRLSAVITCVCFLAVAPTPAGAVLLPGLERETSAPGCPLGFPVLPGTVCPPAEQIPPEEAERDAAGDPRPQGAPVKTTPSPYSSHSMIYACCSVPAQAERAFAIARSSGAGYVRVDVNLRGIFTVREGKPRRPTWKGVDRIAALARRYRLPVVAVLTHVPDHITRCVTNHVATCPAGDVRSYGRYAALIAERLEGVARHFEIVNEPDGRWAFKGSPHEYARMLDFAYREIKHRSPGARILLGGLMHEDRRWISRMLDTPGVPAIKRFDVANVHLRGRAGRLARRVRRWRSFFARRGFRGRLWVTEHGYPGARRYQYDPSFRGGERTQAAFLKRSLPTLRKAGANQVFVTLRDSWPSEFAGEYASEGVVRLSEHAPFTVRQKPAFKGVQRLNRNWRRARRLRIVIRRHLRAARRLSRAGRTSAAARHRRLAQRYIRRLRALHY